MDRLLIWPGEDGWAGGWRAEAAHVNTDGDSLRATGVQLATEPVPYRLDYSLDATAQGFVTRSIRITAVGEGWERRLRLERGADGAWTWELDGYGGPASATPGGDMPDLGDAFDCDLGFSPLTNSMPIRRHGLHEGPGRVDLVAAWISVPDLAVSAQRQRYEHLGVEGDGATVRYASVEDGHETFTAELAVDRDGFILRYPGLSSRVTS